MPRYDYRCTGCGLEIEVVHGMYDSGPEECVHCGAAMRKALSTPTIHFKGTGWAKKDAAATIKKATPKPDSSTDKTPAKGDGEKASTTDTSTTSESSTKSDSSGDSASKAASTAGSKADD